MHWAAMKGHVLVVEALDKMGANKEATTNVSLIPISPLLFISLSVYHVYPLIFIWILFYHTSILTRCSKDR